MNWENGQKVTASHLKRNAYLYVRQSTIRQVFENTESTKRQYALRERAIALGWPAERIIVIDCDQGQSGHRRQIARAFRDSFPRLGWAGQASYWDWRCLACARNCSDWHRLLEICA